MLPGSRPLTPNARHTGGSASLTANDTPGEAESEAFAIGRIVKRARADTASLDGQDGVASNVTQPGRRPGALTT